MNISNNVIDSIESQFWTQTKHQSKELNNELIKFLNLKIQNLIFKFEVKLLISFFLLLSKFFFD